MKMWTSWSIPWVKTKNGMEEEKLTGCLPTNSGIKPKMKMNKSSEEEMATMVTRAKNMDITVKVTVVNMESMVVSLVTKRKMTNIRENWASVQF